MDNDIFRGFIENPNKYGQDIYADISELADSLAGRDAGKRSSPVAGPKPQRTEDVDEGFWDAVRDQSRKYGTLD